MRRLISVVSFALLCAAAMPAVAANPPAKIPLDYKAYDSWNAIRNVRLSADGRWLAYALVPQDGDPVLVVRNLTDGTETREERGLVPTFTADSKFVVFTIRAKNAEIHKAEREHKKPDEQPKNGLGILDLATLRAVTYDRIKSVAVPKDPGSDTIAFLAEKATPSPKPSPGSGMAPPPPPPTLSPSAALSPAPLAPALSPASSALATNPGALATHPSPSPSASPDDLHTIEAGTTLTIRDLVAATESVVSDVSNYAVAHDGAFVAYAVATKDQAHDQLTVRRSADGALFPLASGAGHYESLTFAPKAQLLAFQSDVNSFAEKAPHYALYRVDLRTTVFTTDQGGGNALSGSNGPRPVADAGSTGLPRGWAPSANGEVAFSKDGRRLFFGTAPAPTPVPSGTPEPVKVSIWSWHDGDLQSYQRKHVDDERKRTFTAVANSDGTVVQLASPAMRVIRRNENEDYALGADDVTYRKLISWYGTSFEDEYAVSLHDGSRRLLLRKTWDEGTLSPDGRFVVVYDRVARGWYSVRTADGKLTALTARLHVAFYDELDDHPAPPDPYAFGGFVEGSRYVLLADRYDLWAVDPATGKARNLTAGYGRAHHLRFQPVQLDPERDSFALDKPLVLTTFDDDTKASGYYLTSFREAASAPRKLFMLPKFVTALQKSRDAERIVLTEDRLEEVPNLWSAPSLDALPAKVSDANPQKSKYLWATDSLISYKSAWGLPLHGVLMLPENFDRHKKYPMLVYLYERFSDDLHVMPFTLPGPFTSPNLLRYVSNGYVVLVPDIAYRTGHPGKSALDCVLPAINEVVRRGYVDDKRIGVAGHSWGAYQIAYMITKTDRFRAAEAGAAVDDMISAYGGIREGEGIVREFQYEVSQSRIGATPWDRTDLYLENSPLFGIKNIRTPYLTIANDADDAVPWQQGIEFNTALRRLGKEAYMFEFDGELHNLRGREQQKFWTVHLDEFFDHFLKGAPETAWMKGENPFVTRGARNVRPLFGEDDP
jgi:dienelactone hydrolase